MLFAVFFIVQFCSVTSFLYSMDDAVNRYHLVVIPGMNGNGGQLAASSLGIHDENRVHYTNTPGAYIDLGQTTCLQHVKQTIKPLQESDDIRDLVIHASSQGSATAFHYVSQHPQKVKALIIEGMLASGNSAIHHIINRNIIPGIGNIPGSYYILPYIVKFFYFRWYSPTGMQAIYSVDKIPQDIPVILVHCRQDPELAYSNAEAIYTRLRLKGNKGAYLIPVDTPDSEQHIHLMQQGGQVAQGVHAILAKHALHTPAQTSIDLTQYQPEVNYAAYRDLIMREERLRWFDKGIKFCGLTVVAAWLMYYWKCALNR